MGPAPAVRAQFYPALQVQVRRSPERVAAQEGGLSLTYRELERAASACAATLRSRGAGPEKLVAIIGERGLDFLVTILGVLRAGAAYLPLDPASPPERLRRLLESASPDDVVDLRESPTWEGQLEPVEVADHNLAYVIFTSGTTGLPKAAMLEHAGMFNHLQAKIGALSLNSGDRVAHTATPTFDISVWQFLAPLLVGAQVQFIPEAEMADLLQAVARRGCTILETVPSLLRVLLEAQSVPLPDLRWLIPTGEALTPELARRWLRRYPNIPMLNAYGPTECSDDVTHAVINQEPEPGLTSVPIGFPIPGVRLKLIEDELYVGGVAVGRGYRGDPQRTAEVFLRDSDGTRLYRTGDLVRQRPEGDYEYLGRRDQQIKVRGVRVEPGELEAILSEHPAVSQVAVVLSDERLVAYFVGQVRPAQLRAHAAARLPATLVPHEFVALDALPLSPNGKLDRRALPGPPTHTGGATAGDPLEQALLELWSQVLGVPVGVADDFFELGGDSLKAIAVSVGIRELLGQGIAPSVLVQDATVEKLAERLRSGEAWPTVVTLQAGEGNPHVLVPGAGGSVVYLRPLARRLQGRVLGLAPPGLDGVSPPFQSVEALAEHLLTAMQQVCPHGPYRLLGHSLGGWVAYEMACRLAARGEEVACLTIVDMPARTGADDAGWMLAIIEELYRYFFQDELTLPPGQSPQEQLETLAERLQATPLAGLSRMFAAEQGIRYQPGGYFPGTLQLLRTSRFCPLGPQWGWEERAARVVVRFTGGDHMSVMQEPQVAELAALVETET